MHGAMTGKLCAHLSAEGGQTRTPGPVNQMGRAGAVRGAEPGQGACRAPQTRHDPGPGMLPFFVIGGSPDLQGIQVCFDVVQVPVGPLGGFQVVAQTGL